MKFVFLPTGRFLMGHAKMSNPVHPVTINGFWIGQHEVTNRQFEHFRKRPRPAESRSDQQPVTRVSWEEATAFCQWLCRKERVGSFPPNGFGLYDMSGNVEECVSDWCSEDYYKKSPLKDPAGPKMPPKADREHIRRGGYFGILEGRCWLRAPGNGVKPLQHKFSDP